MMQIEPQAVRFSIFTLDQRRRELLADGRPVPLHARAFDVLVFLIQHRHASVCHADILAHVWEGRAVSDNNLSVQLSSLRKALAEAGGDQKLIVTLPNRRYRFVGELQEPPPEVALAPEAPNVKLPEAPNVRLPEVPNATLAPQPRALSARPALPPRRVIPAIGLAAAVLAACAAIWIWRPAPAAPPRLSLVVLPFRNASPDRTQDYLADAITDDLTADLAHIPASTIIARESAAAVAHETPQQISRDLHVAYIVSGSIAPEDGRYHILASLSDAVTGRQLWTTQFDPERDRISEVRATIVRRIASPLNVAIDKLEGFRPRPGHAEDADALDLFFRARSILDTGETLKDYRAAHALLRQAIARQPGFADAQAELGWMLLRELTTLNDPDEAADLQEARDAIRQALAVAPQDTLAIAARALEQEIGGDCLRAKQSAQRALTLDPSSVNARSVLASCAQTEMRFDDAVAQFEAILQLNPASLHNTVLYLIIGTLRLVEGRVPEAAQYLTLAKDDYAVPTAELETAEQAELLLIAAHDLSGRHAQAREEYAAYAGRLKGRTVWRIASYFDAAWRETAGLQKALAALQDAGMPRYADEDEPGAGAATSCTGGAFAPTPNVLPHGGTVLTTAEFASLTHGDPRPLVIDVGLGTASEPSWVVYDRNSGAETEEQFALRTATQAGRPAPARPVIVMGAGVRGCAAYRAAARLIESGIPDVDWYRGGEEAWDNYRLHSTLQATAALSAK